MKTLVLCSGGVDSTTCLGKAVHEDGRENVIALAIYYGQKHDRELQAAKAVTEYYGVPLLQLDLSTIFADSNCSLLKHSKEAIPQESYARQIQETGGKHPVSTYVPFRNGLFLSSAASIALAHNCERIIYGAHADDAAGSAYPDCSAEFVAAMNQAIFLGSGNALRLEAPFAALNKSDVVKLGLSLNVPYQLTWSCYAGGEKPCRKCATCIDREAAFEKNNTIDPLIKEELL